MTLPRILSHGATAIVFAALGFWLSSSNTGQELTQRIHHGAVDAVVQQADLGVRQRIILEHPEILGALRRRGGFGGDFSAAVAQNMFGRTQEAIDDAHAKTKVIEIAPRTWLIRLPIVNAVLFETDEGLVLVDAGMAPAGPALLEAIRSVSQEPIHTILLTHGHVDHAFGTWALIDAGESPNIVAQERIAQRFRRYIRLRGSIAGYMSQPESQMPASETDIVWPTQTFDERLELEIGGETFVLVHHPAETDDQFYVWVPGRKILASADYYQGFLPNAGNGKRVQRHVEEWAFALREMVSLQPEVLAPAHGKELTDATKIRENLSVLAEALEFIVEKTIEGLNAGSRKDQIFESVALPEHLANHESLEVQYVTPQDISKMVIRRYTGWWDDIPSHWSPVPLAVEARTIVELAGGDDRLIAQTREVLEIDVKLACHLADWLWYATPDDPAIQQLVIDVYKARILDPRSNTQEQLAYIDAMARARTRQLSRSN